MYRDDYDFAETQDKNYCANQENMSNLPLARAYVPYQNIRHLFDYRTALEKGTIFPELDLPFGKN